MNNNLNYYIMNNHFINILIRTTYRPQYFDKCINSIYNQSHQNFKIICCYDDERCLNYLKKYNEKIEYFFIENDSNHSYKYNLYMNFLMNKVNDGWIMFLDDDNQFTNKDSLKLINFSLNNPDEMLFWKVRINNKIIIPVNLNIIKKGEIDTNGICFHSKFKNLTEWNSIKGGDYDYINRLVKKYNFSKIIFPYILTSTIEGANHGIQIAYNFRDFINNKNIKQIYISEKLTPIKNNFIKLFNLEEYNNINEISIFFGTYTDKDLITIKKHIGKKFVMFDGNDIKNFKLVDSVNFLARTQIMKDYLKNNDIFSRLIKLDF